LRLRGPLVLIVDDDLILIEVVRRLLTRAGMHVVAARSAGEAREREEHFRAGVFDIELGGECGVQLAEQMLGAGQVDAVVFFTGGAPESKLVRARQLGPVVSKGEHPKRLVEHLDEALGIVRAKTSSRG
jgi:CheY-like chemotaxis protein